MRSISEQMHIDRKIKTITQKMGIINYMKGSYKPKDFIEQFDTALNKDDKRFIKQNTSLIKVTTDCNYNKMAIAEYK